MRIVWGKDGARRFEAGLDRGVLYLADGRGVPWDGLTAVEEDTSDVETNAFYFDGTKYMDTRYPGDFSGTIHAITYPDEFFEYDGYAELNNGVLLGHQPVYNRFGLSYRTLIGNDLEGEGYGYKIHILYNLVATPSNKGSSTLSNQTTPSDFSWSISGVPEAIPGFRPTVHIVLDTTRLNPYLIADVEKILYGTDPVIGPVPADDVLDGGTPSPPDSFGVVDGGDPLSNGTTTIDGGSPKPPSTDPLVSGNTEPKLPPLQELIDLLNRWVLIDIVDNGDGTWSATGPSELVNVLDDPTIFQITTSGAKYLDEDTYELSTTHTF